jgi:spermidine synthase
MGPRTRLVLSSALMLFLELALIRWTASNVVHLGYFSNFVLLGSFLGIGLGFLRAGRSTRAPLYFPILLAVLVGFVFAFPVNVQREGSDLIFFTALYTDGPPAWVALPIVFICVAAILAGPGEMVGRCFLELPRLEAYRLDLVGSLIGIVGFTVLSFLRAPSVAWGVIVAILIIALLFKPKPVHVAALVVPMVALVGMLTAESITENISWSPYYKILAAEHEQFPGVFTVTVNGVPHQAAMDAERKAASEAQYDLPYQRIGDRKPGSVLIVGAGTGTDVALALSRGATKVHAVEIDPRLQEIGKEIHPNRPYDDERVEVSIDDGRAFLSRTDDKYDLVIFALPDSLTLVAGASSLRLESYLFTTEALESVRDHLNPGGAFAMYNYYREPWLIDRLAGTAAAAFDHPVCVDTGRSNDAVITAGLTEADQHCGSAANARISAGATSGLASDDHPFLYLFKRSIPSFYLVTLLGILLMSLVSVRAVGGPVKRMRPYGDLFFLGAAFLLLETRAVTGFALLFGTTWVVNALVFAGVLIVVLLAVIATERWRTPPLKVVYAMLAASLLLAAAIPPDLLLELNVPLRLLAAVSLAFAPIFLANLVFAKRFAETHDGPAAFGANLLGAMLGGALEYVSLITGYQALLLLAGVLYGVSFLLLPRGSRAQAAEPRVAVTAS